MHPLTLQQLAADHVKRHDRSGRRLAAGTSGPPHAAILNVQAKSAARPAAQPGRARASSFACACSPGAPPGTHRHPPIPLEPPAGIAAADRGAGSCRLRRAIRNPAPEERRVPTPAPMPAG